MGKFYFTCSFDDGDVADLRLADLLNKYGVKATFFIPRQCELVNKSLCEKQINALSDLVEIGGHTMSHHILTNITNERARSEIQDCKKWIQNITGKPVLVFCPPTGRFNKLHISYQQEAGYVAMRTVEMLSFSIQKIKEVNDFVILPTTNQVYNHTSIAYLRNRFKRFNLSKGSLFWKLFNVNWQVMSKNYIEHLNEVSEGCDFEYYFHLWGHSWEIDKYSLWKSLEDFLKSLFDFQEIIFCNNSELAEIVRTSLKK